MEAQETMNGGTGTSLGHVHVITLTHMCVFKLVYDAIRHLLGVLRSHLRLHVYIYRYSGIVLLLFSLPFKLVELCDRVRVVNDIAACGMPTKSSSSRQLPLNHGI